MSGAGRRGRGVGRKWGRARDYQLVAGVDQQGGATETHQLRVVGHGDARADAGVDAHHADLDARRHEERVEVAARVQRVVVLDGGLHGDQAEDRHAREAIESDQPAVFAVIADDRPQRLDAAAHLEAEQLGRDRRAELHAKKEWVKSPLWVGR